MDSPESLTQMDFWNEAEENDVPERRRRKERCTCGAWKCSGRGGEPSEKAREGALQRATKSGDAAQVAALLTGAGCWPDRLLERVLKMAASEDVVRVFASAVPNFFWERAGGANALLYAASNGQPKLLRALLVTGVAADGKAVGAAVKPLAAACLQGHAACVEMLLEHGADPKSTVEDKVSLLHLAADSGQEASVVVLLRCGAEVEAIDGSGRSPLHWAARMGHYQCVRTLLDAGARPRRVDERNNTPLHWASRLQSTNSGMQMKYRLTRASSQRPPSNYVACVEELVKGGADVNAVNYESCTPLSCAIAEDDVEIARALIDNGADLQLRLRGVTVLHLAVWWTSSVGCVAELLQRPSCPHVDVLDDSGETPLLKAAKCNNVKGVVELLRFGADVTACDSEGFSALHYAAQGGFLEAAKALVDAGADVNATTTTEGLTALHLAVRSSNVDMLLALLERGSNVNAQAANGKTPLHFAVNDWSNSLLEKLLELGADLLARDYEGFSVLHCAAEVGATRCVELLVGRGFPLDDVTDDGRTALHVAAGTMQAECVKHLLQRLHVHVDAKDAAGRTALHVAARATDEETIRELLLAGANRLSRDAFEDTPADVAVADHIKRLIRRWGLAA